MFISSTLTIPTMYLFPLHFILAILFSAVGKADHSNDVLKRPNTLTPKTPPKGKKKGKKKKFINIPIEIGLGPTFYNFSNTEGIEPQFYRGLSLSGVAIINNKLIRENKHMIPKQYRKMALAQDEFRISKLWIPDSILFTNNLNSSSAYGASFRPLSISISKAKKNKGLNADIGARFTYAYINDSNQNVNTHFLRLGLDGRAELRLPLQRKNSLGIGWTSQIYLPSGFLMAAENSNYSNMMPEHVGQIFVKYYYRFPYKYKL
jgi:hypothetical protein